MPPISQLLTPTFRCLDERGSRKRRATGGEPLQDGCTDVRKRTIVPAAVVALEPREQRRVLARVVGAWRGRVAAVVGGDDEQVAQGVQARQPLPQLGVDRLQRAVIAGDVIAVA